MTEAMPFSRLFSEAGHTPYTSAAADYWSKTAKDLAAERYFRRRGGENSVVRMVERVARTIRRAGEWQGYFSGAQAEIFEHELAHILLGQKASFNSPVYFNVGIFPEYGILGTAENFVFQNGQARPVTSAYLHPQASACFIQDVQDDLISIYDLVKSEAKLFKYGSGSGTNFSRLRARGEALDAGGESTGLISYLEIFDKSAQAIRSGGTTRRAAKMVVLDADHPEILEFIRWKRDEERKARVLMANGYSGGIDGEAFRTVSGQNSNNSVRLTDEFFKRVFDGGLWSLRSRRAGDVVRELPARDLFREIAHAAWECADPGVQYHDTIQRWHLCPRSGEIRASNPCSEFMFLDDSACNLASLNLAAFLTDEGYDWKAFAHTARILLFAQEILIDYASYPTAKIAENSHRFRPLGLGYANLGGLLMRMAIPYDSEAAATWTGKITGALHAVALDLTAKVAAQRGAFDGWEENREDALSVLERHCQAWRASAVKDLPWVDRLFEDVLRQAERTGLRNAQVTLIAPTGTIGLVMDCDTLGIEPDFSLVKRKHLAGGGSLFLVNHSVPAALRRLGYTDDRIDAIQRHVSLTGTVVGAPGFEGRHSAVFDCAMAPEGHPERCISTAGHLRIMAAAQPFLSGAISKTVNLPASARVEDVEGVFYEGWTLGLKALAIYRDGSKSLQPLCAEC
jgi:ribonucleoside-diphosphate reductase alpha chain